MLTVASLLAAMTIAGAFWVGVLAARRLRDWGEGRRALEEGGSGPLAIGAAAGAVAGAPPDDPQTRRVRALVAQRLRGRQLGPSSLPRAAMSTTEPNAGPADLTLDNLRMGDVIVVDAGEPSADGDFIVEGIVRLREGRDTTIVAVASDAGRRRWVIGHPRDERWLVVEPVTGHGLSGEPPRNISRPRGSFGLERRGQASAACLGRHERPAGSRAATYLYRGSGRDVVWVERWGREITMGEGVTVEAANISLLPGS
jgi:hypothetical protein